VFHVLFFGVGGEEEEEGGATVGAMGLGGFVRVVIWKHGKIIQVLSLAISPILRTRFYDARRRGINESIRSHGVISTTYKYAPTLVPSAHSTRREEIRATVFQNIQVQPKWQTAMCKARVRLSTCHLRRYAARNERAFEEKPDDCRRGLLPQRIIDPCLTYLLTFTCQKHTCLGRGMASRLTEFVHA